VLLSERRQIRRDRSKKQSVEAFVSAASLVITRAVFLEVRARFCYATKRLAICRQHEDKHREEILHLTELQDAILKSISLSDITHELRPEDLAPSRLEI
jgi:hypothetical protein